MILMQFVTVIGKHSVNAYPVLFMNEIKSNKWISKMILRAGLENTKPIFWWDGRNLE
jgi:hypothetical protein